MPICTPRGCGCSLTGSAVMGGSGEVGAPYEIEAGGITIATSLTRPGSPFQGQQIYETDTGLFRTYISSTWVLVSHDTAQCQVSRAAVQSGVASGTTTTVLFDQEDYDPLGWHSTSSDTNRVTPTLAGWYQAFAIAAWDADTDFTTLTTTIRKNGATLTPTAAQNGSNTGGGGNTPAASVASPLISMNGTTDYIDMSVRQTNTSAGTNSVRPLLLVRLVKET